MTTPGPKELANRANGEAKRKRKLIPYAGKPKGNEAGSEYGRKPTNTSPTPARKRRQYTRKIT